jgi:glycosyltransferase involved in cell wall biosynthesis
MKKYIYCVGLHKDGGLNILNKFLTHRKKDHILIIDSRIRDRIIEKENVIYVSKNLIKRFFNLIYLSFKIKKEDHILFLSGIPPVVKFKSATSIVFQNANLFRDFYKVNFYKWLFSKDSLRFLAFIYGKKNVDNWYTLSPIAKKIISKKLKKYVNIKILDIFKDYKKIKKNTFRKIKYDFIYPASLMEHKNHKVLIDSMILLSKKNIFPSLLLTLDKASYRMINIDRIIEKYKLKIFNHFEPIQDKFQKIYKECDSLVYMSSSETIGLPILEAYQNGLTIIAPQLDYSQQFINPHFLFNLNDKYDLCNKIEDCFKKKYDFENHYNKNIIANSNSISLEEFYSKIL